MALSNLLNSPTDGNSLDVWTFHNADSHAAIISAILAVKGIQLTQYLLDPVDEDDMNNWLLRHQQSHTDFTSVLGIGSNDLSSVDWKNDSERDAWIGLHFREHYDAYAALGYVNAAG
jgi:hypothetical protein